MDEKKVLTVDEAADLLGYRKNYIYKLISMRKLPYYKPLHGKVIFNREELESFAFSNKVEVLDENTWTNY